MKIKKGKLGTELLKHGFILQLVQLIVECVLVDGIYEDSTVLVTNNQLEGEYLVKYK